MYGGLTDGLAKTLLVGARHERASDDEVDRFECTLRVANHRVRALWAAAFSDSLQILRSPIRLPSVEIMAIPPTERLMSSSGLLRAVYDDDDDDDDDLK
ncbi:hypothetical protein EVAR_88182_1 [Eumeta japonica]|uniref:Uncharacterized protein n=1 Tax=Eumeta variegata TaxID=151549 RepID=A0A4C1WCC8_EUMVA|nr:hypothetical protein EVAR_88182_1 [Eumeta japonica]